MSSAARPAATRQLPAARLRLVVGRIARRMRQSDPGGLTPAQVSALVTVEAGGPLRLGDLAARESVGAPAATRLVTALEGRGYVRRTADPHDGRSCRVVITEPGRRALAEVRRERTELLEHRLEQLSAEHRRALDRALPALEALADGL